MFDSDNSWLGIMEKYKNSVLKIRSVKGLYDIYRPQNTPRDKEYSGTGFFIDIENGLIATNCHVVANSMGLSATIPNFGEKKFNLKLISLCQEKDLAICQVSVEDRKIIIGDKDPSDIDMVFGDSIKLRETETVMTIGYPLGQKNIKFTTGVVSGFHGNEDEPCVEFYQESVEDSPSYIQITAPVNPGNSGGPLLNKEGQVVGINAAGYLYSQNIAYAIGSRTFLSIYDPMVSPIFENINIKTPFVFRTPKYAFDYCAASDDLLKQYKIHNSNISIYNPEGVYITNVYPDSVCDYIQKGDILNLIEYEDYYIHNDGNFKASDFQNISKIQNMKKNNIIAFVDKFGDCNINLACSNNTITGTKYSGVNNNFTKFNCRKFSIKELLDIVPVGSNIKFYITRITNSSPDIFKITSQFSPVTSSKILKILQCHEIQDYEIFAGISVSPLTVNHIENYSSLDCLIPKHNFIGSSLYKPKIIINQIFPGTEAYKNGSLKQGMFITHINNHIVENMVDLRKSLNDGSNDITIVTSQNIKFVVNKDTAIYEDNIIYNDYNIPNKYIFGS